MAVNISNRHLDLAEVVEPTGGRIPLVRRRAEAVAYTGVDRTRVS